MICILASLFGHISLELRTYSLLCYSLSHTFQGKRLKLQDDSSTCGIIEALLHRHSDSRRSASCGEQTSTSRTLWYRQDLVVHVFFHWRQNVFQFHEHAISSDFVILRRQWLRHNVDVKGAEKLNLYALTRAQRDRDKETGGRDEGTEGRREKLQNLHCSCSELDRLQNLKPITVSSLYAQS